MRSYEAARSVFALLEFLAWGLIIIGAIIALLGGFGASEMSRWGGQSPGLAFVMGIIPGLALALGGFLSLALAQIGRAGVDTAEYSQQMLQLSRDQLEVSRQSLLQGEEVKNSFGALAAKSETSSASASYADLKPEADGSVEEPNPTARSPGALQTVDYRGREIVVLEQGYRYSGMEFATLTSVHSYIDQITGLLDGQIESPT